MVIEKSRTPSEETAAIAKEEADINAELAEIDRQLAEMENSPDKPERLSHLNQEVGKSNIAIFANLFNKSSFSDVFTEIQAAHLRKKDSPEGLPSLSGILRFLFSDH